MPSYIIHLAEAEIIWSMLEQKENFKYKEDLKWKKLFQYGVLLPDIGGKEYKKMSHFWDHEKEKKIIQTPDLYLFLQKHKIDIDNPLLYGYFAHLHLDKFFWENYVKHCITFINHLRKEENNLEKVEAVKIQKSNQIVSMEKFFSEEYLYGDYTKLNLYFIRRYGIKLPEYPTKTELSMMKIQIVDLDNFSNMLKKIEIFIKQSGEHSESILKVFQKDLLERFLKEMAKKFLYIERKLNEE